MTTYGLLEFSSLDHRNLVLGSSTIGSLGFNTLHDIFSFQDLTEDNMASIQPSGLDSGDEKLGSISVWSLHKQ